MATTTVNEKTFDSDDLAICKGDGKAGAAESGTIKVCEKDSGFYLIEAQYIFVFGSYWLGWFWY